MPETIDGEVYQTTPVIPASTNAPAGGNRPYPTGASKGKAMWQLIERAMRELDKFEAGPLRQLFDRVVAAEKAVTSTSPQRRLFTKLSYQSVPTNGHAVITWDRDTACGDPGEPAAGADGISYASTGVMTVKTAGLYEITLSSYFGYMLPSIRRNGTVIAKAYNSTASSGTTVVTAKVALAVNDTVDIYMRNTRSNAATSFPELTVATQGETTTLNQNEQRTTLTIVRLGA